MVRYTPSSQLTIEGFSTPFEQHLNAQNRWVELATALPWDSMAKIYIQNLQQDKGRLSVDVRMALGALIIKHKLKLSDREVVQTTTENVYLQYFCGLSSFCTKAPFDASLFVDLRKRMGADKFDAMNRILITRAEAFLPTGKRKSSRSAPVHDNTDTPGSAADGASKETPDKASLPGPAANKGTLKIDATVADQCITYPNDLKLVSTSRWESERLIDALWEKLRATENPPTVKPRSYRRQARKRYLDMARKKNKAKSRLRKAIGQQLRYLRRNLGHIEKMLNAIGSQRFPLSLRDQRIYWVIQHIYNQQHQMWQNKVHSIPHRIVNIYQPYVRPILRGKDKAKVEFGAKISASEYDGFTTIDHISWEAFNEGKDLIGQAEKYRSTFGCYPELLLADSIYLNRENRKWMKSKGVRIVGKPLGRPPREQLSAYQKRKRKKERNQRNHVEGKFGQAKYGYRLHEIRAKRQDTSEAWMSCIFFITNLITFMKLWEKYAQNLLFGLRQALIYPLGQAHGQRMLIRKPISQHSNINNYKLYYRAA